MNKKSKSDRDKLKLDLSVAFGVHVKKLRSAKGFSMRGFADIVDIEYSQIARIENGTSAPTILTIYKLAEALDVPMKDLFDFKIGGVKSK